MESVATNSSSEWRTSPADSSWRQGQPEAGYKIKKIDLSSVGVTMLPPSKLQSVSSSFIEAAL